MLDDKVFTINNVIANQQIIYNKTKELFGETANIKDEILKLTAKLEKIERIQNELFKQAGKRPVISKQVPPSPIENAVLAVIQENNGLTAYEIGKKVGISRSRACSILNSVPSSKIMKKRVGHRMAYYAVQ